MGVCDGPGRAGTAIGLLITQRSRVQIPPPLLVSAAQGLLPIGEGPWRNKPCDQSGARAVAQGSRRARLVRRASTERDSVEPGRRSRSRSLGAWPRSSTRFYRPLVIRAALAKTGIPASGAAVGLGAGLSGSQATAGPGRYIFMGEPSKPML